MHPVDAAILRRETPPASEVGEPAKPGASYYWDCRGRGLNHHDAINTARAEMRAAKVSVAKVENRRLVDPLRRNGGKRPGAGRPNEGRVQLQTTVAPETRAGLDELVGTMGLKARGRVVDTLVANELERRR